MLGIGFLPFFNLCSTQIIGNLVDWPDLIELSANVLSPLPLVLDHIDEISFGRYSQSLPTKDQLPSGNTLEFYSNQSKIGLVLQYQKCNADGTATLILTEWMNYRNGTNYSAVRKVGEIIDSLVNLHEDPRLIFIELNPINYDSLRPNFPVRLNFNRFSTLAVIFVFFNDSLNFLCVNCGLTKSGNRQLTLLNKNLTFPMLPKVLDIRKRNINFEGGNVIPYFHANISDCSFYHAKLLTPSIQCTMAVLGEKYNFTHVQRTNGKRESHLVGMILNSPASLKMNKLLAGLRKMRLDWFIHGISYQPFQLKIFTNTSKANFAVLLSPFDVWIWMCLLLSLVLLIVVGSLVLRLKKKSKLIFWTISVILEQVDESLTTILFQNLRWKYFLLILGWSVTAFILGVIYKGSLFSCLTANVPPDVPSSLRKALLSPIPIITTGCNYYEGNGTEGCISALKYLLIKDLLVGLSPTDSFHLYLNQVANKTVFVNGSEFDIVHNISLNLPVLQEDTTEASFLLPETFGVLNAVRDLNDFSQAMKLYSPNTVSVKNHDMNPFVIRTPWIGSRNFFYQVFSRGLSSLVESGIYDRWQNYEYIGWQLGQVKLELKKQMVKMSGSSSGGSVLGEQNNILNNLGLGKFYARFLLADTRLITFTEANPVSFPVMQMPFAVCLILLLVCILSFVIEWIREYGKKSITILRTTSVVPFTV
jgi:hypothetical protein